MDRAIFFIFCHIVNWETVIQNFKNTKLNMKNVLYLYSMFNVQECIDLNIPFAKCEGLNRIV